MLIQVISLRESGDRRERITRQMQALSLPFEFLDAIRGSELSPEAWEQLVAPVDEQLRLNKRLLKPNEVGCALSHLAAYRRILERQEPGGLILEDDALLLPNFSKALSVLKSSQADWLVMGYPKWLAWETKHASWIDPIVKPSALSDFFHEGMTTRNGDQGALAYYVSRQACQDLLALNQPVRVVADRHVFFSKTIRIRHLRPVAVMEDSGLVSTIQGKRRSNAEGLSSRQYVGRVLKGLLRHLKKFFMEMS